MASTESTTENVAANLGSLNYDCLRELFNYLEVEDAFATLGIFNSKVDEVALDRIKQTKKYTINMRCPPNLPPDLIKLLGRNIESFTMYAGYSMLDIDNLEYFKPFCAAAVRGNLTKLCINYIKFNIHYWNCISPLASQIEVLDVAHCILTEDFLTKIVSSFPKLRTFNIIGNMGLSEKDIKKAFKDDNKCKVLTDHSASLVLYNGIGSIS